MTTVANLEVVVGSDIRGLTRGLNDANSKVEGFAKRAGDSMQKVGTALTTGVTLPLVAVGTYATRAAIDFDEALTNIQSVTGQTDSEIAALSDTLLEIGAHTRAGPQAVADSMYDIAGGVSDATTHMAILQAAIATAEAGNADLGATTSALIAIMNSYSGDVEDAAHFSDVLTRSVAVGVGTMDEFAAGLSPIAGIADSAGISFDELAADFAYLTTQGFSAGQSSTRLQAAITALLKPNEDMTAALKEMGYESGSAALEQLGLQGAMLALAEATGGSTDEMAAALGSTEALGAALALASEDATAFNENFTTGVEGATEAAQAIQLDSAAAQMDLLKSSVDTLAITIGEALLPPINDLISKVMPVVQDITDWAAANPEATRTILMLAGGAALLGPALGIAGTAVKALSGGVSGMLSPLALGIGLIGGLVAISGDGEEILSGLGEGVSLLQAGMSEDPDAPEKFAEGIDKISYSLTQIPQSAADGVLIVLERITGQDLSSVAEGVAGWGVAFESAGQIIEVIIGRISRGFETFKNNLEVQILTFIASVSQTAASLGIQIAPDIQLQLQDAKSRQNALQIADKLEADLGAALASGEPVDLSQAFSFANADWSTPIGTTLMDELNAIDVSALSVTGLDRVQDVITQQIQSAIGAGDTAAIEAITPLAMKFSVDPTQVQQEMQAAVEQSAPTADAEAAPSAPVNLALEINPGVAREQLAAQMTVVQDEMAIAEPVQIDVPSTVMPQMDTAGTRVQIDQHVTDAAGSHIVNATVRTFITIIPTGFNLDAAIKGVQGAVGSIAGGGGGGAPGAGVPAFAAGGYTGMYEGLAYLHRNEHIIPNDEMGGFGKSGGTNIFQIGGIFGTSPRQALDMMEREAKMRGR